MTRKYTTKEKLFRALFILVMLPLVGYAGWCGYAIFNLSQERAVLKKDYSDLNNIQYGLLSVDRWRDNITEIVFAQIEQFELSGVQEDTLKIELNKILNAVISQADEMINEKQKHVGGKLKKFAFQTFINVDKIRARVPEFSQTIIDQIKKPRSMERLKLLTHDKINEFAGQTHDSIAVRAYDSLLVKYNTVKADDLNKVITARAEVLQQKAYNFAFKMLGVMLLFLLIWLLVRKTIVLINPLFTLSIILALTFLFIGLAAPMIEIDARIQELNFILIGKSLQFQDQVLFYQSKSIIDVVKILIETGKADSVFVGLLLLLFSIIFPVAKLLSSKIYLLSSSEGRNNRIIKFFAFKSGKWSMADVMVVAIFMAYIGFRGILNNEIGNMNIDLNNQYATSISTSKTSLQPGFILFVAFVIFGLILSEILNKIRLQKQL